MVMPVIHDVFTITHQFSINYITLNLQVPLPLLAPELYLLPCITTSSGAIPRNYPVELSSNQIRYRVVNLIVNNVNLAVH